MIALIKHTEAVNSLLITNVAPLLQKDDNDLIIIFTSDLHAVDRCIDQGIYNNFRLYNARNYTPELQITQCYNCGKYSYPAAQCKKI
jgi:hypothetical protein